MTWRPLPSSATAVTWAPSSPGIGMAGGFATPFLRATNSSNPGRVTWNAISLYSSTPMERPAARSPPDAAAV